MGHAPRNRWISTLAVLLLVVPFAAGCGGGGHRHSSDGFLEVTANASFGGDYVYRIDVFDDFGFLVTSDDLFLDDGLTADLGAYADGIYDIDVYWTNGFVFPVVVDTLNNVDVFAGLITTVTSFEP